MHFSCLFANLSLIIGVWGQAKVTINSGDVVGEFLKSGVRVWKGIPFAKSPPERFSPPEDPIPWKTPLTTTQAKPACIQQFNCKIFTYLDQDKALKIF